MATTKESRVAVRFLGSAELERQLAAMDVKVQKAVLRKGISAASEIVRAAISANAPVRHGILRSSVAIKLKTRKGTVSAFIGPEFKDRLIGGRKVNPGRYGHLVEGGTKPHLIRSQKEGGRGKLLKIAGIAVWRKAVKHPGAVARPFMAPAWERSKDAALAALAEYATLALRAAQSKAVSGATLEGLT